jgi:hypothetical protein
MLKNGIRSSEHWVRLRVTLRLAKSPLRLTTINVIFQLNSCGYSPYVTTSLTRGCACHLQLILVSESCGTRDHILLFQTRNSSNLEGQVPIFLSPRNRVAQIYDQAVFRFRRLLRLAGLRWKYSTPPSHGIVIIDKTWPYIYLLLYSPCGPWPLFQCLNIYTADKTSCTVNQSVARPPSARRRTQTE